MNSKLKLIVCLLVAAAFMPNLWGCASRSIKPEQSYDKLKPIDKAPPSSSTPNLAEQAQVDNSTGVQTFAIEFVNQESSNRNLTPQRRIVFPDPEKAITSPRPSRIMPGQASKRPAVLKQPELARTITRADSFEVTPITVQAQPVNEQKIERVPSAPAPVAESGTPVPARGGRIALQINTVPLHAEVIVDDKYLGQSPLITYIDRHADHVIQISKPGYEEKVKFINHHEFGDQKIYFLIEKLEAKQ